MKQIYWINGVFGIVIGVIVILWSLYSLVTNFNFDSVGWLIGGIVSVGFGFYQWNKHKEQNV